ncbi:hypothetical protein K7X08_030018 [Anisodus acutangulus]|uniref:Uncharacterized protein n=1 Tax=Anisodus acutangulus TaxID=402998 RepID=A0A9Q1R3X0_9SOLA|nr:hypothetical protein K7X08_030018 [Anisodus acutangulus]
MKELTTTTEDAFLMEINGRELSLPLGEFAIGFGSQILIETFQNMSLDSGIRSYEGNHISVDEKYDIAPSDADLSSIPVGVVAMSDEVAECDDLQTSQEMVSYS